MTHYKTIRQGLRLAGVNCAILIHPWGSQIPGVKLRRQPTGHGCEPGLAAGRSPKASASTSSQYHGRSRAYDWPERRIGWWLRLCPGKPWPSPTRPPEVDGRFSWMPACRRTTTLRKGPRQVPPKGSSTFCNIEDVGILAWGTAVNGQHGRRARRLRGPHRNSRQATPNSNQVKVNPRHVQPLSNPLTFRGHQRGLYGQVHRPLDVMGRIPTEPDSRRAGTK